MNDIPTNEIREQINRTKIFNILQLHLDVVWKDKTIFMIKRSSMNSFEIAQQFALFSSAREGHKRKAESYQTFL